MFQEGFFITVVLFALIPASLMAYRDMKVQRDALQRQIKDIRDVRDVAKHLSDFLWVGVELQKVLLNEESVSRETKERTIEWTNKVDKYIQDNLSIAYATRFRTLSGKSGESIKLHRRTLKKLSSAEHIDIWSQIEVRRRNILKILEEISPMTLGLGKEGSPN